MYAALNAGNMSLVPNSRGLYRARGRMRDMLRQLDLSQDEQDHLLIAVGEAISNAYLHGTTDPRFDRIEVAWRWANDEIAITIRDNGSKFSTGLRFCPSGHRGVLARGIELMRAGTDELGFSYSDGARVELVKRLPGESAA